MTFRSLRAIACAENSACRRALAAISLTALALLPTNAAATLAGCPAGSEGVYYRSSLDAPGGSNTVWRNAVAADFPANNSTVGARSFGELDSRFRSHDGTYPGNSGGLYHVKTCHVKEAFVTKAPPQLYSAGGWVQGWPEGVNEPSCPTSSIENGWTEFDSKCAPCTSKLTLAGGGTVDATKSLAQTVRVGGCYDQPQAGVPVQIAVTPLSPPDGPSGNLRLAGTSGTGTTLFSGVTDANGEVRLEFVAPALAGTHNISVSCSSCTPNSAGPKTITVNACRVLSLEGGGQVEPGAALSGPQQARVENCDGTPASDVPVVLKLTVDPTSGRHPHGESIASRPIGELTVDAGCSLDPDDLSARICSTNTAGLVPFGFQAPALAGEHAIEAACLETEDNCGGGDSAPIVVKIEGIEQIPASQYYTLTDSNGVNIGNNGKHNGINHYLIPEATAILEQIAAEYAATVQPPEFLMPLYVNDASLEWGGLFDIGGAWATPHVKHRHGTDVDIRANTTEGTVPEDRIEQFLDDVNKLTVHGKTGIAKAEVHCKSQKDVPPAERHDGGNTCKYPNGSVDENRHIHIRLLRDD